MNHREFISQLDETRIVSAIGDAEKRTTGEIRVYISHKERHDALAFATKRFQQLGMTKTKQRNAVLIYIVPKTHQFAIVGDEGIHQRCDNDFWNQIAAAMSARMKAGEFTDAIVNAIHEITDVLAKHFPGGGENPNELTNEIARD
jgi:uncharacterized membrane protein